MPMSRYELQEMILDIVEVVDYDILKDLEFDISEGDTEFLDELIATAEKHINKRD